MPGLLKMLANIVKVLLLIVFDWKKAGKKDDEGSLVEQYRTLFSVNLRCS